MSVMTKRRISGWLRAVLFDETCLNLRNRAAHGLLRDDERTPEAVFTLTFALVALLRVAHDDGSAP